MRQRAAHRCGGAVGLTIALLAFTAASAAAEFGTKGGAEPANIEGTTRVLQKDPLQQHQHRGWVAARLTACGRTVRSQEGGTDEEA
jgi:hypothetical protein